jgi:hypothetical protein
MRLVTEMKRKKVSYKALSQRLAAIGIDESPERLNRKVNRKRFSAAFLLACLAALGSDVNPAAFGDATCATPTGDGADALPEPAVARLESR